MSDNAYVPLDRAAAPPLLPFHDVVNVTSANDDAHTPDALSRGSANPTYPFKDNEWSEHTKEGEILANLLDFEDPREEEERALFDSIRDSDDPPDVGVDSDQAEALPSTAMDQGYRALEDYKELDDEATGMEHLATVNTDSSINSDSDVDMPEDQERVNDDEHEHDLEGKPRLDDASSFSSDSDDDASTTSDSHTSVVYSNPRARSMQPVAEPSAFPLLRRSKCIAESAPKRARDEDCEDALADFPPAKRAKPTATPAPRRRTTRARATPEPAPRATRTASKGKKAREPSRPLKMACTRASRIPKWFLEKHCIVNEPATCGAADCDTVLCANKPADARKHVRVHHRAKGELKAAGAAEVMCLWGDCENMIRRGKNGGELLRHYDEVHLQVRYVCPGKCKDGQGKLRSFRRTDQITRHEKDNPCAYLKENPIPRGGKDPNAKPRTATKPRKR